MIEINEKQREFEELWGIIKQSYTESEISSFCSLNDNYVNENDCLITTSNCTTYGD